MKHYVYIHKYQITGIPFYVGKGTTNSQHSHKYHRAYSKLRRNEKWYTIISKFDYTIEIVFSSDNEKEVYQKERELIKQYGRLHLGTGSLCNIGNGGSGGCSIPHLPEWSKNRFKTCYRYDLKGNFIDQYDSYHGASRILKINRTSIGLCIKGKSLTAGGYQWRSSKEKFIGPVPKSLNETQTKKM